MMLSRFLFSFGKASLFGRELSLFSVSGDMVVSECDFEIMGRAQSLSVTFPHQAESFVASENGVRAHYGLFRLLRIAEMPSSSLRGNFSLSTIVSKSHVPYLKVCERTVWAVTFDPSQAGGHSPQSDGD